MKLTRNLTALLAVLGLVLALCIPMTVAAAPASVAAEPQAEETAYFGRSVLAKMKNGEALCYAYDRLVYGCEVLSDNIDIAHRTYRINSDEAFLVWEIVTNDHPEYYWLSDGISLWGSATTITALSPSIPADAEATRTALNQQVTELTDDLKGKSDYEKSLILHDRVVNATTYQFSAYDQNVVGSLLMGQSVCAGYARGYQLLLQAVGIPSYVVTGSSFGQAHAWNLVQLDGEWYYTDVTWDDQNDNGNDIYYAYLNLPYAWMAEDHVATHLAEYLPQSTATAANYHIKNGTAMATPNVDKIVALYEAGMPIRLYATEGLPTLTAALDDAVSQVVARVACPYSGYSYGYGCMGRELILQLSPSKPHSYGGGNTCQNCGYTKTENHQYVSSVTAPTCLQDGKTVYTCSTCGDSYTEIIPALGHQYDEVVTEPTCTEDGAKVYTCRHCGDSYSNPLPATGEHVYDNDADAVCNLCGHQREVVTMGDVDGNGKVNNRDLGMLQRFVNEWNVSVDVTAADLDGNGRVNNRDLGLMQKLLNA